MTFSAFLKKIPRRRGWYVREDGAIRDREGRCPMEAAADLKGWSGAARCLGLPLRLRWDIMYAADGDNRLVITTRLTKMRRELCRVLSLNEHRQKR